MKNLLFTFFFLLMLFEVSAQIQFNLNLLSDQETYMVSMVSEKTIPQPMNMASNLQVVLKIPEGKPFLIGEINSLVKELDWVNNAFAKQVNGEATYGLSAFTMVQGFTKNILIEAGVEIPLFTFKNMEPGCVGAITLPDNQDIEIRQAVNQKLNFTQNITLLSSRGNAFTGIGNKVANCSQLSTSIEANTLPLELTAYPVPAYDELTIKWTNPTQYESLTLELLGANSQLIRSIDLPPNTGTQQLQLAVQDYPAGLYTFLIKNDKNEFQKHKFIKVR